MGLCTQSLVWEKGPKRPGMVLPHLAAAMPNAAGRKSRRLCASVWGWKRPTSCSCGRGDPGSPVLKALGWHLHLAFTYFLPLKCD